MRREAKGLGQQLTNNSKQQFSKQGPQNPEVPWVLHCFPRLTDFLVRSMVILQRRFKKQIAHWSVSTVGRFAAVNQYFPSDQCKVVQSHGQRSIQSMRQWRNFNVRVRGVHRYGFRFHNGTRFEETTIDKVYYIKEKCGQLSSKAFILAHSLPHFQHMPTWGHISFIYFKQNIVVKSRSRYKNFPVFLCQTWKRFAKNVKWCHSSH